MMDKRKRMMAENEKKEDEEGECSKELLSINS
jgi:hypothetical protein